MPESAKESDCGACEVALYIIQLLNHSLFLLVSAFGCYNDGPKINTPLCSRTTSRITFAKRVFPTGLAIVNGLVLVGKPIALMLAARCCELLRIGLARSSERSRAWVEPRKSSPKQISSSLSVHLILEVSLNRFSNTAGGVAHTCKGIILEGSHCLLLRGPLIVYPLTSCRL